MSKDMLGSLTRALVGVPAHMLGLLRDIANRLSSADGESFYAALAKCVRDWKNPVASSKTYLRRLFEGEEILVPAVLGTETLEDLAKIFTGGIYGDASAVSVPVATPATTATVDEMVEKGNYAELFESLGQERRRFTSLFHAALFCRDNPGRLRKYGYGTFFELDGGFVALVYFDFYGRLKVYVSPFSDDHVGDAEHRHRLVSLQQ